jgi:hypothetical protein
MKSLPTVLLLVAALPAAADDDAITRCRAAHAADPAAHIRCLEQALQGPAVPAAATVPIATATAPAAATATAELGVEQAQARQRAAEPAAAAETAAVRIVEVRYNTAGLGVFRMADGQVWQETVATPERLHLQPGKEYDASIVRGSIGGYRMHVDGVRWMHKIERL